MRYFLIFFQCTNRLFTKASIKLLIGLTALLYISTAAADISNAPFSIFGNLKITHISDGDSLRSGELRIRLFGVDAPEINQQCAKADGRHWDCGVEARKALKQLVESAPKLTCELRAVDRYARLVMRCFAGKTDVAAALVRAGLALAYRQYSELYSKDENTARITKAGMWDGSFTKPWTWRRTQ